MTITITGRITQTGKSTILPTSINPISGDTAIFMGTYSGTEAVKKNMEYFTITTPSTGIYFGDLTIGRGNTGGASNGLSGRGMIGAGDTGTGDPGFTNTMEYFTINTPANAETFGEMVTNINFGFGFHVGTSNGTNDRGQWVGAYGFGGSIINMMDYVTISTLGNSTIAGDLYVDSKQSATTSNGTSDRGIVAGGQTTDNTIQAFSLSSPANATNSGDLPGTFLSYWNALIAISNASNNRALFAGGSNNTTGDIVYRTISTNSNATTFGNLVGSVTHHYVSGTSNAENDTGIIASNPMEHINIMSLGDAVTWGYSLITWMHTASSTSDSAA